MEDMVSIITPTYARGAELVKRTLDSLIEQTYKNIEIILVDDNASLENSLYRTQIKELALSYGESLKLIQNERPLGGAVARNVGIAAAKGSYITFLDDDDKYFPEKIEKQLAFMKKNDLDMCFTSLKIYNEQEKLIDFREFSSIKDFSNDALLKYHLMHNITGTPTFMYKKSMLTDIGGFDDVKVSHEYYLMFKTIKAGAKIGYLSDCGVAAYRHRGTGISRGNTKVIWEKKLYEFKKQHSCILCKKEKRYIKFRYHAVMMVVHLRNKSYFKALGHWLCGVFTDPVVSAKEFGGHLLRRMTD